MTDNKNIKSYIALTTMILIFCVLGFSSSIVSAESFTLSNSSSIQKFAIEGKGGWFKKDYSFTITVTGGSGQRQKVMTFADTTYRYSGIDSWSYIAGATGKYIPKGQAQPISFKGKGQIFVTIGIQKVEGQNVTIDISPPRGFSVRKIK